MLDHTSHRDREKLAGLMARWNINLLAAKGLFWASAAVAVLVWAIKS